jgi:hypothetical protein
MLNPMRFFLSQSRVVVATSKSLSGLVGIAMGLLLWLVGPNVRGLGNAVVAARTEGGFLTEQRDTVPSKSALQSERSMSRKGKSAGSRSTKEQRDSRQPNFCVIKVAAKSHLR